MAKRLQISVSEQESVPIFRLRRIEQACPWLSGLDAGSEKEPSGISTWHSLALAVTREVREERAAQGWSQPTGTA